MNELTRPPFLSPLKRASLKREVREEAELIKLALDGDGDAFAALIAPYIGMFAKGILNVLKDNFDVEDALQDAIIHIHQGLLQFRSESKFSTWAFRICINEALMARRSRLRRQETPLPESSQSHQGRGGSHPPTNGLEWKQCTNAFKSAEGDRFWSILHEGLAKLGPLQRETFELRDIQGLTTTEVAQKLRISPGLVRQRLHRARRELRDIMGVFRAPVNSRTPIKLKVAHQSSAPISMVG